jgi:hypothetical protein
MQTHVESSPPTGEGLTFEKVWAMFQKSDLQMQEVREQQIDNALQLKETDRLIKELRKSQKKTSRQMGDLHNRFGEIAEHLVAPGIAKRFNEMGYHFDAVSPGGYKILNAEGKTRAEIDILLENSEYIIAVEVKTRVHEKDIEHHIKRLEILKEHRLKNNDRRIIRGAMAAAVFGSVAKKAVIEAGFYVFEQSGDTMKVDVPEGFSPRQW